MNFNIFSPLRNLFRLLAANPAPEQSEPAPGAAPRPDAASSWRPARGAAPPHDNGHHHNGKGVELPMQPILAGLPLELQPRLIQADVGALTISVPLEKILAQLSRGAVQISFGELRQAAPDLFTPENDRDRVMVPLPLGEILARLNPALITRRRAQKQVEVPAEIASPFDQRNRAWSFQSVRPGPRASAPAPGARARLRPAPAPLAPPARGGITSAPTPTPPGGGCRPSRLP